MKILDEEIQLIENVKSSWKKNKPLWLLFFFTIFLDSLTTIRFMLIESIDREANILIRWLAENIGIVKGVIIGKFLQIIAALGFSALSIKYSRAILLLLIGLNLLAAYHNFDIVEFYGDF